MTADDLQMKTEIINLQLMKIATKIQMILMDMERMLHQVYLEWAETMTKMEMER